MYRRITMTAIMLTLLGGLALLGGRARQTHATPAGTLGTRFPLYVAASNTIITVDSTGVQRPVTAGGNLDAPAALAFSPGYGIVKLTEDTGFPEVFLDNPIPKYKGLER